MKLPAMKISVLKTKPKILLGICSPLVLLAILGGVSGYNITTIVDTDNWVNHTHEVLEDANAIVGSAVDMETGMRGYLLAGRETFLAPYKDGEEATYKDLAALQETVNDNPKQVERLAEVERVLREWQEKVSEPAIAVRREIGDAKTMNDMAALVGEARGKVYFDRFRDQIATFICREQSLLNERRSEFQAAEGAVSENFGLVQNTTGWVDHSHEVLAAAARLLADAVDMETGMRGFLLAGDEDFLAPYEAGKTAFFEGMQALQKTVDDNPAQLARLQETETIIRDWLEKVTEPAIALRRQVSAGERPLQDIQALILRKEGKQYFDAFRVQITDFSQVEMDLMAERQETAAGAGTKVSTDLKIMNENEEWVTHTYAVIGQANDILAAAVDMETGMRGYLLAGQDAFLAPYTGGAKRFHELVANLRKTVDDNPAQVALLDETAHTIRDWQKDVTEPTIALRRKIGDAKTMDDMADLIAEARGKQYFDRFRQIMTEFTAEETGLMQQRQAANATTVSTTFIVIAACVGLALLLGIGMAWLIGNGIANPIKLMTEVMQDLAKGDTSVEIPGTDRKDEIGEMAQAVQIFKDNAIERQRLEAEAKRAEEALREAQKMEALGTLAGGIAHDFNNALLPIIGLTELTLRKMPKDSAEARHLDKVRLAANHAQDLVHQILAFSRQEPVERRRIDLCAVVDEACELLRSGLPTTIRILKRLEEPTGIVLADPIQIRQVVVNLGANAGDAMAEEGGILTVEMSEVQIGPDHGTTQTELTPGPHVRLAVTDTGRGIDRDKIERIFEPFFTTKDVGKGTGLGLSVAHGIVMSHDGAITVQSEPGKGSTFAAFLPLLEKSIDETGEPDLDTEGIGPCPDRRIVAPQPRPNSSDRLQAPAGD